MHLRTAIRRLGGNESGQALIMAVSLLILLALLSGLFIAMITARLSQSARKAELIQLQQIAEAGQRYADDALTNGAEGADWRPDPANPTAPRTFTYGAGRFTLTVTYDPTAADDYWNCIKVESVADFGDQTGKNYNPFLRRRVVQYKRLLLTDYSRFVTNRDHSGEPAELGVPLSVEGTQYTTVLNGPVRVNSDLVWYGRNLLNLFSAAAPGRRDDQVEVAGIVQHAADTDFPTSVQVSWDGGGAQAVTESGDPAFTTLFADDKPRYVDGIQGVDTSGNQRWARYLAPPRISRQRYLRLTRDSGDWDTSDDGLRRFNTGWYGYGSGIYIANAVHLQSHNYEVMRNNWLGNDTRWWDSPRTQVYTPPAVSITLHGGDGEPAGVEMIWPDPAPGQGWRDEGGDPLGSDTLTLPYPDNGVIYAEGNVSVSGALPASQCVTIVSEGNIYLDGPVIDNTDAKVALLARDSVVLNTTVSAGFLYPTEAHQVAPAAYSGDLPAPYEISPGQPFEGRLFCPVAPAAANLYLLHSGAANELLPPGHEGQTVLNLLVNGNLYDWGSGADYLMFKEPPTAAGANESNAVAPLYEGLPDATHTMALSLVAGWNTIRFETPSSTVNNYWLYKAAVQPLDIEIDALIYAETGSWFIIPGSFFTPEDSTVPEGFPDPGEPLDVMITVRGAIAENRTANAADVAQWVAHWRGSNANWNAATGTSSRGLTYEYDPELRLAAGNRLLLPRLPVSPEAAAWEEQL